MLNKIREAVKGIKIVGKYFVDAVKDASNDKLFYDREEITPDGYILRKNTTKLVQSGVAVAGVVLVEFSGEYVPCIYTDTLYDEMNKNGKDFVIQHELGHFTHHQETMINGFERNDKMEFEADEYAAQIMGYDNAIDGLKELRRMLVTVSLATNKIGITEVDRRIQHLEELKNI